MTKSVKGSFISDPQSPSRDYGMDNLRALLILFAVFGHLLETLDGNGLTVDIYRIIYSFHMPAFVFIMGYFA